MTSHRATLALFLTACLVRGAEAQTVRGTIFEAESREVVAGASVRLLDGEGRVVGTARSDAAGAFGLRARTSGVFRLGVEVFGYAPTETDDFRLAVGDSLALEIHLEYSPIALETLVVSVFNEIRGGFERRRGLSYGTRLGPEDLAERSDLTLNEFAALKTPWLNWRSFEGLYTYPMNSRGRRCVPMIFVDGRILRVAPGIRPEMDRWMNADDVRGVEVYPDGSSLPAPFYTLARFENNGNAPCGLIAVWTTATFGEDGPPE